ncbi:MAG: DUF6340 family protein [Prevotellaceae bacterium]|nr:DUF6340 family protein [Prevotellaceae bacterium]
MKKFLLIWILPALCCSCFSLEQLSVDFLEPSELSFPNEVRKVGVVNNMSVHSDRNFVLEDTVPRLLELARRTSFHIGEPTVATRALADQLAGRKYFDQITVCDSALRAEDKVVREQRLSRDEVQELAKELDADVIISLENIQIRTTRLITLAGNDGLWGTIDAQVATNVTLYLPTLMLPWARVAARDSIFWEDFGYAPTRLISNRKSDDEVVEEASEFAASLPLRYMAPYWKTVYRYYYTGGNTEFRDAAYLLNEGRWDEAAKLWERVWSQGKKKAKKQMYAAFNMALYCELSERYNDAKQWLAQANRIRIDRDIREIKQVPNETGEYQSVSTEDLFIRYGEQLDAHIVAASRLRIQMQRFDGEKSNR